MFLVLLDVTIVNVALPGIGRGLHAGVATLQWVVDGYVVAIAGLLLAGGTLGDRFGHRRVLLAGFALFGVASLACALAPTVTVLVGGRVVQGVGGALLLPSTMAVIVDVFPERGEQARALGTWAAFSSLALPAGPVLGGLLVGWFGWRPVFWINVPLTGIAIAAALWAVPDRRGDRRGRLDVLGLAGFVAGLSGLVCTVIAAGHGAGAGVLAPVGGGAVAALAVAGWSAGRSENPILPLDLLRRRAFLSPNLVALTGNLIFNGILFVGTLYLQDVRGLSPAAAGVAVLPLAVPLVVLAPVAGRCTARWGARGVVSAGCGCAALGSLLLLGAARTSGFGWLLGGFVLLGVGAGLITASVVAAVVAAAPPGRSGLATGVSNTARQIGTASGVAIFGAVAGAPSGPHFVSGLHLLALAAAAAWLAALAVTRYGIAAPGEVPREPVRMPSGTAAAPK
ncbi:MFS transporter [Nocardia sp. alder85J]|uniref:MFS transporter n=1 Tax=Nocardia sp. alder85J TaxID=2862949 RepID=UPI00210617E7|nr:MFS transporter [Nocardia sp. alder85J]MCX4091854.1 MFS transporter [Nocardia sp. alder85J]